MMIETDHDRVLAAWRQHLAAHGVDVATMSDDQVARRIYTDRLRSRQTPAAVFFEARFRDAAEFGVLYSHASQAVYPDLVDGPLPSAQAAQDRLDAVLRAQGGPNGIQGILVARLSAADEWLSRAGHRPIDLIRLHEQTGNRLGWVPRP